MSDEEEYITGWNIGYFCLPIPDACIPTSKAWLLGLEQGEQERIADVFRNKEQKRKEVSDGTKVPQQLQSVQQARKRT